MDGQNDEDNQTEELKKILGILVNVCTHFTAREPGHTPVRKPIDTEIELLTHTPFVRSSFLIICVKSLFPLAGCFSDARAGHGAYPPRE